MKNMGQRAGSTREAPRSSSATAHVWAPASGPRKAPQRRSDADEGGEAGVCPQPVLVLELREDLHGRCALALSPRGRVGKTEEPATGTVMDIYFLLWRGSCRAQTMLKSGCGDEEWHDGYGGLPWCVYYALRWGFLARLWRLLSFPTCNDNSAIGAAWPLVH